ATAAVGKPPARSWTSFAAPLATRPAGARGCATRLASGQVSAPTPTTGRRDLGPRRMDGAIARLATDGRERLCPFYDRAREAGAAAQADDPDARAELWRRSPALTGHADIG